MLCWNAPIGNSVSAPVLGSRGTSRRRGLPWQLSVGVRTEDTEPVSHESPTRQQLVSNLICNLSQAVARLSRWQLEWTLLVLHT